ncbi:MAG: hypothetical protein Q4G69_09300 [Planctomycetia bacterium]|nr:hypothetical protein [Planctomycetia bacterium]
MSDATKMVVATVGTPIGGAVLAVGALAVIAVITAQAAQKMLEEAEKRRKEAERLKKERFVKAKGEAEKDIASRIENAKNSDPMPFISQKKIDALFADLEQCAQKINQATEEEEILAALRTAAQIQDRLNEFREQNTRGTETKNHLKKVIEEQKAEMAVWSGSSESALQQELNIQAEQIEKITSFDKLEQAEEEWAAFQSEFEASIACQNIQADLSQKQQIHRQDLNEKKVLLDHLEKEWSELVKYKKFCTDNAALFQQWEQKKNNFLAGGERIQNEWITNLIKEVRERNRKEKNRVLIEEPFVRLTRSVSKKDSMAFDAAGYLRIEKMLAILKDDIEKNNVHQWKAKVAEYESVLERHLDFVLSKAEARNREIARVNLLLDDLQMELDLLCKDEIVDRWMQKDLKEKSKDLEALRRMVAQGNFAEAEKQIPEYKIKIEVLLAQAEELERKENVRAYLVEGFENILADMGFQKLEDAFLADPDDPRSALILRTERVSGDQIALSIPQNREEPIQYSLDGFPMREEAESGQLVRTCDEAVQELEYLHQQLKELGIETSELYWEGKPDHLYRQADHLPQEDKRQNNRKMDY